MFDLIGSHQTTSAVKIIVFMVKASYFFRRSSGASTKRTACGARTSIEEGVPFVKDIDLSSTSHARRVSRWLRENPMAVHQSSMESSLSNGLTSCGSRLTNTAPPSTVFSGSCPGKLPCGMLFSTNTPNAAASRSLFLLL